MALTEAGLDLAVNFATNAVVSVFFLLAFEAARYIYPYLYNRRRTLEVQRPAPVDLGGDHGSDMAALDDGGTTASVHVGSYQHPTSIQQGESAPLGSAAAAEPATPAPALHPTMVDLARTTAVETRGFFGWLRPTLRHDEAWILAHRGRDAVVYLRFVWTMLWLFVGLLVALFIIIVPANASGTNKDLPPTDPDYVAGLLIISMANIAAGDTILWLHAVMVPVITAVACAVAYQLQRQYLQWQVEVERPTRLNNRAVLVRGIRFSDADGKAGFDLLRPVTATLARVGGIARSAAHSVLHDRDVVAVADAAPTTAGTVVEAPPTSSPSASADAIASSGAPPLATVPTESQPAGSAAADPTVPAVSVSPTQQLPDPISDVDAAVPRWQRIQQHVLGRFADAGGADSVERVHLVRRDARLDALWVKEKQLTRALRRAVYGQPADILADAAVRERELGKVSDASAAAPNGGSPPKAPTRVLDADGNTVESPQELVAAKRADDLELAEAAQQEADAPGPGQGGGDDEHGPAGEGTAGCCGRCGKRGHAVAEAAGWTQAERRRKTVDRIAYARRRLHSVRATIRDRQAAPPTALAGVGVVVFRTAATATAVRAQALAFPGWDLFHPSGRWDINWPWLHVKSVEQASRRALAWAVVAFLVFFWSIPATFVQGLGNLRELAQTPGFSWLNPILDFLGPGVEALLNAYLPSLLLVLLMAAVPPILRKLTVREGYVTNLMTERVILSRFFLFLIVNVFLVTTIAGSVLGQLQAILQGEQSVASLLAVSLPSQGPFFIGYLMVKFCFTTMDLLRPHILGLFAMRAVGRPSAVEDFVIEYRPTIDFGPRFGWDLLVVVLALTYSLLYPFILVFAVAYFAVVAVVHRHNIVYLHRPRIELQGQLWPHVLTLYFVAVLVFQWTMVGWFSLQESAALTFPVLGTVILAVAWYRIKRLKPTAPDLIGWFSACRATVGERTTLLPTATLRRCASRRPCDPTPTEDTSEPDVLDDDDYDGFTAHGRIPVDQVVHDYFVEPIMYPPAAALIDDPFNPFRPQV